MAFSVMSLGSRARYLLAGLAVVSFVLVLYWSRNPAAMDESSANVKHITEGGFGDEVLRCRLPVVVDFYAAWCAPCRELSPMLDRVAGGYARRIKFVKVNVDETPDLARDYQVTVLPTVLMFADGKVRDRVEGLVDEAELKRRFDTLAAGK